MIELALQVRRGSFTLSVDVRCEGVVTGVFGHSGAGKSSLLHVVAGLVRPDQGLIRVNGEVLLDTSKGIHVAPHQRRVGVVFQDARLFPHYSVRGNLEYGLRRRGGSPRFAFDEIVTLLQLGPLLERPTSTLSGGEGQRVALGRALLSSPRLLLLDEPVAALDKELKQQILPFLELVRDELRIPMLYVSHDLCELLQMTDDIVVLDKGKVIGQGAYRDVALQEGVLSHHAEVLNVIRATVREVDATAGFAYLQPNGGDGSALRAPSTGLVPGAKVTAILRPEDVALSLSEVTGTSIQNQIPGTIERVVERNGQVFVEVYVGVRILAEVTARTMQTLKLAPGQHVWCLIKTRAIKYASVSER